LAIDPDNPVVKLCAAGIQAEMQHQYDEAQRLYVEAWSIHTDDFEACIAAHYLARQQATLELSLQWNLEALHRAEASGNENVSGFLPSLYLNLGWSHEMLSHYDEAHSCYELAARHAADLPDGGYTQVVRSGVTAAQARLQASNQRNQLEM
jgi:tetratricopeptide (TPR) repeat protein